MKKIFVLLIFVAISINVTFAAKDYSVNFNGNKFHLLYSVKNKDFGGYLNEYYKKGDTYNIWSEMIAVHHFPNAYSPIDRIKDFKDYLGSMQIPSSLTFDDKNNTAMIDFIMISEHNMPIIMEFNIFKYEKSKKCGSIAIQYAKRYTATTTMQIENIKKDIEKHRKSLINKVKHFEIPEVISTDIDKCISANNVKSETNEQNPEQKDIIANEEKITANIEENNNTDLPDENINTTETVPDEKELDNNIEITTEINTNTEENKPVEYNKTDENQETNTNITVENAVPAKETESQQNDEVISSAPIPDVDAEEKNEIKTEQKQNTKEKNIKETSYVIENNKEDFYAKPRSPKELKEDVKKNREKQRIAIKQSNERKKAEAIYAKKVEKQKALDEKQKAKINKQNAKNDAINAKMLDKQKAKDIKLKDKQEKKQAKIDAINTKKLEKQKAINEKIKAKQDNANAKHEIINNKQLNKQQKKDELNYLKEKQKQDRNYAKGEKYQAKADKKAFKEQNKIDKQQNKLEQKELKQKAKEDKKIEKRRNKIQKYENKKAEQQLKADKKQLKKEEIEKRKQEKFNQKSSKKAENNLKKSNKKSKK